MPKRQRLSGSQFRKHRKLVEEEKKRQQGAIDKFIVRDREEAKEKQVKDLSFVYGLKYHFMLVKFKKCLTEKENLQPLHFLGYILFIGFAF